MKLINRQIAYNRSPRWENIKYIVIHDTGNTDKGSDADANFSYFNTGNRNASADIFVDDHSAIRANDYMYYYSWHCGDGGGRYGITNANSVGIEICINSDGNYALAVSNAVEVTRQLMRELGIPADRVVRHYDASRKCCPASMSANNWTKWNEFKARIVGKDELTMAQYEDIMQKLDGMGQEIQELKQNTTPMIYNYIDDNMPEYARPTIQKLVDKGLLKGDGNGLNLDETLLRILVINDRAGLYD